MVSYMRTLWKGARAAQVERARNRVSERRLQTLNDTLLRDIGLIRSDIESPAEMNIRKHW